MSVVNETVTVLPNGKDFIMSVTYAKSEVAGVKVRMQPTVEDSSTHFVFLPIVPHRGVCLLISGGAQFAGLHCGTLCSTLFCS